MSFRRMFNARGESGCTPHMPEGRMTTIGLYLTALGNGDLLFVKLRQAVETGEFYEMLFYSQPRPKQRPPS